MTLIQESWISLRFDPTFWKEGFELSFIRLMHELFKDPFEVSKGIEPMTAHLFNEGVDDRTSPTSLFSSNKHPILHPEFRRTNGSFGVVVINLNLTV